MNHNLLEKHNLKHAWLPVDLNTAAVTGARIKMDKGHRCAIIVSMSDSVAATDVSFFLKQHNAATAGTTKALELDNPYYVKAGAATVFTKVAPAAAVTAGDYDLTATFASEEGFVVFEVLAEDLDVNNGFFWISLDAADAGASKHAAAIYVVADCKYAPAYEVAL